MTQDAVIDPTPTEEPVRPARRRGGSRAARWLGWLLAAILALIVLAVALINSPIGKRYIADQIAAVAPASGLRFSVGRIEGNVYGKATLHDVVVSDPSGAFLTVPVVRLDWRPLSWLTSGLDVRELSIQRGTLMRVPELLPGDPDAPLLPDFDIRVDKLEIAGLTVAPGVIDERAHRVNVLAEADIRQGHVYFQARGQLGDRDRFTALVDAEPDRDRFDLSLDYRAPQGGVIAGLVGAEAGYRAIVDGDGSWADWKGRLYVQREGERFAAFRLTNRAGRYGILGQAYPGAVVEGLLADALGETVSLAANGTLVDSRLDGRFGFWTDAFEGRGNGAVELAGNAFDALALDVSLKQPDFFSETLALEGAQGAFLIDGAFRDLTVRHEVAVERLVSGTTQVLGLTQTGIARYDGARWTLPLDARVARVVSGSEWVDPRLVNGTLGGTLVLAGDRLASDDLVARFPGATARLTLRGDIAAGGYALAGPVDVQNLALDNIGTASGTAKVLFKTGAGLPWTLRANLAGRISRVSNATLANLAGPQISFRGGIGIGGNAPLTFTGMSLAASKLQVTLDGRVVDGRTTLAGRGRHVDYGPFTVEGQVGPAGPEAVLVFADPLPSAGLKDVRIAISPTADGFAIETRGESLLGRFDGTLGLFAPAGGPTRIAIQRLDIWQTQVRGDITLVEGGVDGTLLVSRGGVDGTIALTPRGGGQGFDVDLTARNAQFGGATRLSIARADIDAQGLLVDGNTTITGRASGQGLQYGSLFVGRFNATAQVRNGRGDIQAAIAGQRGSRFNLLLDANVAPERIDVLARGNYGGRRITMPRRAVLLKQDDGGWLLRPTQISYGRGIMIAEGELGGATTAVDLKLARMPLSLIDVAGGELGLGGTISGLVEFRSNGDGVPVGNARVQIDDLSRSGLLTSSLPIDLSLVLRLTPDRLETRAVFEEGATRLGRLQARITGLPASGGLYERLQAGALFAQWRYEGPADALWRLTAIETFDLTGPVRIAANITGTLAQPQVRGSVASDAMRVRSALSGTDIQDVRVRGGFSGSRLRLTSFRGRIGDAGTVSGSGIVDLAQMGPERGPSIDLKAAASNARLVNANGLSATVTGPLRIVSDGVGGTIAGRVQINRASWRLGTSDEVARLPNVRVREINVPADYAPPAAPGAPWRYLVDASTPSRIDVDGMGLDSEWGADIRLRGTTDDPRIGGVANVVRGAYSFAGTRFELTRGRIEFDPSGPIDPRLDIEAETDRDGLEVTVDVTGNAMQPEISFRSNPALPEEELLSRLLFGDSITSLSATDALQLGAALASLRGGGGMDPINQLRTAIGLDRLRIVGADPALDRETGVALGKNFGRRVYVEIITDGRGYSATEVEFRITSWLALLGSISTVGRESFVAEISKDY